MNLYNRPLFYIGAVLIIVGTYLEYSQKSQNAVVDISLTIGIILALLSVKKPKNEKGINV